MRAKKREIEQRRMMLLEQYQSQYIRLAKSAGRLEIPWEEYVEHINRGEKYCNRCRRWEPENTPMDKKSRCFTNEDLRRQRLKAAWEERKKIFVPPMKGKKMTEASLKKMRLSAQKKPNNHRLGAKHTLETRVKMSQKVRLNALRGEQCHSYKDGKVAERRGERFSQEYKRWRFDVFTRDKFTCQQCGDNKGGNLNAHHIKPFAEYPELRFEVTNGITLCQSCHDKIHYPAKGQNDLGKEN